jgi:Na+/melibiose symporter-like transporter
LWNLPSLTPGGFRHFVAVAVMVRLFIALYEIPSASLVPELTDHYDERTTILGYRFLFGWWGGLAMSILAYAVFLQPDAEHPTGVLNPEGYHRYGIVASIVMFVAVLVSAIGTHRFIPFLNRPPAVRPVGFAATLGELRETVANRSFRVLFAPRFRVDRERPMARSIY